MSPFCLRLRVDGAEGPVPAVAWLPERDPYPPVVLLLHGGSGHKSAPRNLRLGTWFADHGIAALAVDGPFHGDRRTEPMSAPEYQRRMVELTPERVIRAAVHDWVAAAEALGDRVDRDRCACLGLSFGARLGIPLAERLGPSLRAAVLGKFGLVQSDALPTGLATPDLHRTAAATITAPVLVPAQRHDELFPLEGALELFDAFGSADKTLLVRSGPHAAAHPDDEHLWREFVRRRLADPRPGAQE